MSTFALLLQSRKFWVGTVSALAIVAATLLVCIGKIPMTAYLATVTSLTTLGGTLIGSIAWEDSSKKGAPQLIAGALLDTTKEGSK